MSKQFSYFEARWFDDVSCIATSSYELISDISGAFINGLDLDEVVRAARDAVLEESDGDTGALDGVCVWLRLQLS